MGFQVKGNVANIHQIDAKFELIPLVRLGAGASGTVCSAIHPFTSPSGSQTGAIP